MLNLKWSHFEAPPLLSFSTISHTVVSKENFLVVAFEMDIYIFLPKITTSASLSSRNEEDYYNEQMIKNITKDMKALNHSTPLHSKNKIKTTSWPTVYYFILLHKNRVNFLCPWKFELNIFRIYYLFISHIYLPV